MFRKPAVILLGFSLLLGLLIGVSSNRPAYATPSVTTQSWPSLATPASFYTHGNGSITVTNSDCPYYFRDPTSTATSALTFPEGSSIAIDSIPQISDNSYQTNSCDGHVVAGSDGATFVVQTGTGPSYRISASRNGTVLWTQSFANTMCGNKAQLHSLMLGYDGDVYGVLSWGSTTSCTGKAQLVGFRALDGYVKFQTDLTSPLSAFPAYGLATEVMPYETGIAVVNNGVNVYYYGYDGTLDTGKTFTPSAPSGSSVSKTAITKNGRAFILTTKYTPGTWTNSEKHLYAKDLSSSTITEITAPTNATFTDLRSLPDDGVITQYVKDYDYSRYMGYYSSSAALVFEKNLSSDHSASLVGNPAGIAVDASGNVVVIRTMDAGSNRNVFVDSFSSTGTETTLLDSDATFGTAGQDLFTTNIWSSHALGDGKLYLVLCHQTSASGGWPSECTTSGNPQIITVPTLGGFDYPRSEVFAAEAEKLNYVALGDSYSAGEGNPPFIVPTDNNGGNGCDRSTTAYPIQLVENTVNTLRLRAFVACSGATSDEVYTGKNGEPSQLDSLDASTNAVTVTSGGNDAYFADFAAQCVTGTCDAGSSQYGDTLDYIDNHLQDNLELLFSRIRTTAPNAAVYVLGYPELVSSGSCPSYLSSGEQIAVETVVTSLNNKLLAAVQNTDTGFHFVDPTTSGSPFLGHDLCSSNPYFLGLNIAEHRFSFHPNAGGIEAYTTLLATNM